MLPWQGPQAQSVIEVSLRSSNLHVLDNGEAKVHRIFQFHHQIYVYDVVFEGAEIRDKMWKLTSDLSKMVRGMHKYR